MFKLQGTTRLLAKLIWMVSGVLAAALLCLAPQTAQASTMRVEVDQDYAQAYQVLDLMNQQRKAAGRPALTMDKDLMDAAMQRAAEISVIFEHTRPDGTSCLNLTSKAKGENIALGQADASSVMTAWMNSTGHKANILYEPYTIVGVGCVKVGNYYCWVQCFGWDKAKTCSKPSNVYNKIVTINFDAANVVSLGGIFALYPVEGDGETITDAKGSLIVGASQRYALMVQPYDKSAYYRTKVQDTDVTWSVNNSGVVKLNTSNGTVTAIAAGSFTLTAKTASGAISKSVVRTCEYRTFDVVFRSQGYYYGTTQKVVQGSTVTRPTDPKKSGYTFVGWYTDAACRTQYDFSTPVNSSFTLHAKFESASGKTITGSSSIKQTQGTGITSFYDVPSGVWYYSWVTEAAQRGLMSGPTDASGNPTGYFQPDNEVTRAQVATILWRIAGKPGTTAHALWDAQGHWAEDAIAWCVAQGIITGYTSGDYQGMFRPDVAVTRQELAVMVWRFAKWAGVTTGSASTSAFNKCVDTATVASWAKDAMVWCAAAGIITGSVEADGSHLNPGNTANRAQAAKIFVQLQKLACGEIAPYSGDEGSDSSEAEAATFDEVTFDEVVATTPVSGTTEGGLAYVIVSETDVDGQGDAYVAGRTYDELGGRYEGTGAYILGYTGSSSTLTLPASIEGAAVVSANLAWGEGRTIDMAADLAAVADTAANPSVLPSLDDAGHARLTALAVSTDSGLVALNVSGNLLQGIEILSDAEPVEAAAAQLGTLRFLDVSLNPLTAFDTAPFPALETLSLAGCPLNEQAIAALAAWAGTSGLTADLTGAGYTVPEVSEGAETATTAEATANVEQDASFESVEFDAGAAEAEQVASEPEQVEAGEDEAADEQPNGEVTVEADSSDAGSAEAASDEGLTEDTTADLDDSFGFAEEESFEELPLAA